MSTAITIYHNPDCGTSRAVLAMVREAGHEPNVVEYRQTGWTRPRLEELFAAIGATPRELLRARGTPAAELGLLDEGVSDAAILDAMVAHPILVERPIVATPKGTALCRPAERARALL